MILLVYSKRIDMITYFLTNVPLISKLYIMYHQDRHYFKDDNIYLLNFSENYYNERYHDMKVKKDIKYYIASILLGKLGDIMFSNYSTYNHCIHLYHKDDDYEEHFTKLPMTYKWLFKRYT